MENKKKIRIAAVVTAVLFMVVMMGSVLSQTRWGPSVYGGVVQRKKRRCDSRQRADCRRR